MPGCCAYGCSNRTGDGVCLKVFPRDPVRRAIWAAKVNRKNWFPKDTSYLCEKHFEDNQWEVTRVDGKKKLKANAIPTIFYPAIKRNAKGVPDKRRKQLRSDDNAVIEYIEQLEAIKRPPECVVCCRPLVDDRKEYLSTLTATTGLSLRQCLLGISGDQSLKIKQCTMHDAVCYYCAHLINYADKIEADLMKLKNAINSCLHIQSLSENAQMMLKQEFDSHIAILDEFSERVVGPGSSAARDAALKENSENTVKDTVVEEVMTALGNLESSQVAERKIMRRKKGRRRKVKGSEVQNNKSSEPPKVVLPILKCQICQLRTTSHSVLLFHLRRHMATYQWCDFCDTPVHDDDESDKLELNEHSDSAL